MIVAILTGLVALLHIAFLALEMFLWQTPFGRKIFGLTRESAAITAPLAKNQGLYNGFLAAGLIWSFFNPSVRVFFLTCVVIAGIFGAVTVKPSIFIYQGLPALLALAAIYLGVTT